MKILIIIPAYNEGKNIEWVINKLLSLKSKCQIDILIINDCSTDNTSEICRKYNVNVIDHACNLGIGGSVQTGYKYAYINNYDCAVQVDGDGQHNPEDLEIILEPIKKDRADIVIGSRFLTRDGYKPTLLRLIGINYLSILIKLITSQKITDPTSGYRAVNSKLIKFFARCYPRDYPEPESLIYVDKLNLRILEIPVRMRKRSFGSSSINFFQSMYYMIKISLAIIIDKLKFDIES